MIGDSFYCYSLLGNFIEFVYTKIKMTIQEWINFLYRVINLEHRKVKLMNIMK